MAPITGTTVSSISYSGAKIIADFVNSNENKLIYALGRCDSFQRGNGNSMIIHDTSVLIILNKNARFYTFVIVNVNTF